MQKNNNRKRRLNAFHFWPSEVRPFLLFLLFFCQTTTQPQKQMFLTNHQLMELNLALQEVWTPTQVGVHHKKKKPKKQTNNPPPKKKQLPSSLGQTKPMSVCVHFHITTSFTQSFQSIFKTQLKITST